MAVYHIRPEKEQPKCNDPVKQHHVVIADDRSGKLVYFIELSYELANQLGCGSAMQGPYPEVAQLPEEFRGQVPKKK